MRDYDKPKILGLSSWSDWKEKTGWNDNELYNPDDANINILKQIIDNNYNFVIFGTTFCDDCKEHIPKIIKLLNKIEVPDSNIKLYGLDYDLTEPTGYYKNFSISSTPCLIVMKSERIIGTISYPDYNWEENIIRILKNKKEN